MDTNSQARPTTRVVLDIRQLEEARLGLGLTQDAIRAKLGCSKGTIWRIFHKGECGIKTAAKIAKVLKLDLRGLWLDPRTMQSWRPTT